MQMSFAANLAVANITVDTVLFMPIAAMVIHTEQGPPSTVVAAVMGVPSVAKRAVVEVVVEMETRSSPSLGRRRLACSVSQLSSLGASQIQMLVREVH